MILDQDRSQERPFSLTVLKLQVLLPEN